MLNCFRIIFFLFICINCQAQAKEFKSKFNFSFELTSNYQIINNSNLYEIYIQGRRSSHKNQINIFSNRLKQQDVEILYNFNQSIFNNISILVFNDEYMVDKKNVLKQCKKILKMSKKFGKKKVDIIECRMHEHPKFANWSMYRENESSFFENVLNK